MILLPQGFFEEIVFVVSEFDADIVLEVEQCVIVHFLAHFLQWLGRVQKHHVVVLHVLLWVVLPVLLVQVHFINNFFDQFVDFFSELADVLQKLLGGGNGVEKILCFLRLKELAPVVLELEVPSIALLRLLALP